MPHIKPNAKPFTKKQTNPTNGGSIANKNKLNHAIPTSTALVFQRPNLFNSEINLMP